MMMMKMIMMMVMMMSLQAEGLCPGFEAYCRHNRERDQRPPGAECRDADGGDRGEMETVSDWSEGEMQASEWSESDNAGL